MTYSMMRFAAYDWAKGVVHTDPTTPIPGYKMALAGSMAGGIAGFLGNPAELVMVRMQADKAKPVERGSLSLYPCAAKHLCFLGNTFR